MRRKWLTLLIFFDCIQHCGFLFLSLLQHVNLNLSTRNQKWTLNFSKMFQFYSCIWFSYNLWGILSVDWKSSKQKSLFNWWIEVVFVNQLQVYSLPACRIFLGHGVVWPFQTFPLLLFCSSAFHESNAKKMVFFYYRNIIKYYALWLKINNLIYCDNWIYIFL